MRGGLSLVRDDRHLSSIFLIWSWATLAYTGINVAEIVLTTDAYGAGDTGFGVFVAFSAAGILIGNVVAMWFIERLTVYGGYRASFLVTAAGVAICAVSPNLAIGCVGAVIFGVGNGIGLVCNVTLIQQVVSDERRGQIFAVLGSLVQTFTLIGTLAAGPDHRGRRPADDVGDQRGAPRGRLRQCCRRLGDAPLGATGPASRGRGSSADRGGRRDPGERVRAHRHAARRGRADA